MLWPPQPLEWLSDNKIRLKWLSMSRYVSIRRKVKQWGWKTKNFYSEFKWRQNAKSASPAKPPQSQHETAFTAQSTFVCHAFHSLFLNISEDKSRPGLDFICVELTTWKYEEETQRLKFKVTLQSNLIYPNGSATFACTAHSCIFYPKHLTMFNQFTHSLGMELMNIVLHYAFCLFKASL